MKLTQNQVWKARLEISAIFYFWSWPSLFIRALWAWNSSAKYWPVCHHSASSIILHSAHTPCLPAPVSLSITCPAFTFWLPCLWRPPALASSSAGRVRLHQVWGKHRELWYFQKSDWWSSSFWISCGASRIIFTILLPTWATNLLSVPMAEKYLDALPILWILSFCQKCQKP